MEKNQRTLTIPFISAKDLERVKLSNNMEVYAYVSISGGAKQKTAVDRDGDTNPTWKGHITFNLDKEYAAQILVVELNCCEQNGGDKVTGEVFVKVKDLMGSIEGSLAYHVQTPSGNPKGKLYFMYEWEDEKVAGAVLSPPPPAMAAVTSFTAGYPPPPVMGPPPYGAAAAAAEQYNSPYPPPALVMEPPPPGDGCGYGYGLYPLVQVQEQAEPAKKKKVGSIGGWLGRVFAGAVITDIVNNVSLPDDLGF